MRAEPEREREKNPRVSSEEEEEEPRAPSPQPPKKLFFSFFLSLEPMRIERWEKLAPEGFLQLGSKRIVLDSQEVPWTLLFKRIFYCLWVPEIEEAKVMKKSWQSDAVCSPERGDRWKCKKHDLPSFIIRTDCPFTLVHKSSLEKIAIVLCSRGVIVSDKEWLYACNVLDDVRIKLTRVLFPLRKVWLSYWWTDGRSSVSLIPLLGMIAHWFDDEWSVCGRRLGLAETDGSHSVHAALLIASSRSPNPRRVLAGQRVALHLRLPNPARCTLPSSHRHRRGALLPARGLFLCPSCTRRARVLRGGGESRNSPTRE